MDDYDHSAYPTHPAPAFKGNVIYAILNPVTGKLEQVDAESEFAAETMVIPLYWVPAANLYVTVPGTETYGFVPDETHDSVRGMARKAAVE